MDIHIWPTAEDLAAAAAAEIARLAAEAVAARGRFALALSGGSTPRAIYRRLAAQPLDWARIHWFWGDERCVPAEHADSNYRLAREALIDHIPAPAENVHRVRTELGPAAAAADYERELRAFFGRQPRFDLALLGLGEDGHTASLFPGGAAVAEQTRWVVAQEHSTPPPPLVTRITLTPAALNASAEALFLVTGAGKAARAAEILRGPRDPLRLPAQAIQLSVGRLRWWLDAAAAPQ